MAEHEDRPEGEPTPEGEPASEDAWWESTAALLFTPEDKAALAAETDTGALPVLGAEPVLEERATEWFNVEESFDDESAARLPRRHHHVTAGCRGRGRHGLHRRQCRPAPLLARG